MREKSLRTWLPSGFEKSESSPCAEIVFRQNSLVSRLQNNIIGQLESTVNKDGKCFTCNSALSMLSRANKLIDLYLLAVLLLVLAYTILDAKFMLRVAFCCFLDPEMCATNVVLVRLLGVVVLKLFHFTTDRPQTSQQIDDSVLHNHTVAHFQVKS